MPLLNPKLHVALRLLLLLPWRFASGSPHIVFVLVDDLGYNGVGFRNPDVRTPAIDSLASAGLVLESFYTYKVCAPTRAAFLTGRYPFHLRATKTNFAYFDTLEGTDLNYTLLPEQLKDQGYATHAVGKWHQGFYAPQFLPTSRGFDSYVGFLSGCEDHDNQQNCCAPCNDTKFPGVGKPVDLFANGKPALGRNGTNNGFTFTSAAVSVIEEHARSDRVRPLFLYLALQNTHAPFQVPARYSEPYSYDSELRNTWSGMVAMVDESVANVTLALRQANMWDDTLIIVAGDNGSPVCGWGAAGSNAPLRGGKASNWEGGVRTFALASGGFLPQARRGMSLNGLVHIADFYRTFLSLAGLPNATDPNRNAPTALDSLDVGSYLLGGESVSPRTEIVHDHYSPTSGAIRVGDFKLLVGAESQATWFGEFSPNASFVANSSQTLACTERPCLFNIRDDPTEHVDLADTLPDKAAELLKRFQHFNSAYHPSAPTGSDNDGYCAAAARSGGFMVPWKGHPVQDAGVKSTYVY